MRILDLDLDFFVSPIANFLSGQGRLSSSEYKCSSPEMVEEFLELRCGLSKHNRIPGRSCENHDEAFYIWREWIAAERLVTPFEVVHVDAHADMGMGDPSWTYLLGDFLALPLAQRANPTRGWNGINCGNYLTFAIGNRWLRSLAYVFPTGATLHEGVPTDIHPMFFRDGNWKSGPIEMAHFSSEQLYDLQMLTGSFPEPLNWEPAVLNKYISADSFFESGFTHMILAKSPGFTPVEADNLIPIIEAYLAPI